VLAGGRGRRLGGIAKGLELVGGSRIVDRVVTSLRQATQDVLLAANDPAASEWLAGVPVVSDLRTGAGGLAGLEAALAHGRDVVVVAWDMPFVPGALLREIASRGVAEDLDAVVPASTAPHGFEPFCAYYAARVASPLGAFLDADGRAAHEFVQRLDRVRILDENAVRGGGDPARLFFSVNTPADLARARAMADSTE
jgi:molybdopterin-guanine dinucleotide biosynthesis protein A